MSHRVLKLAAINFGELRSGVILLGDNVSLSLVWRPLNIHRLVAIVQVKLIRRIVAAALDVNYECVVFEAVETVATPSRNVYLSPLVALQ